MMFPILGLDLPFTRAFTAGKQNSGFQKTHAFDHHSGARYAIHTEVLFSGLPVAVGNLGRATVICLDTLATWIGE